MKKNSAKKLGLILTSIVLFAALIVTLCACTTYPGVKRKFKSEGWTENEQLVENQESLLKSALGDDYKGVCKIHALKKNDSALNYVIILEFDSTKEMDEKIKDSDTLQGMIKDAQKSDRVSGTCILLFYTPMGGGDEVFKSTK